MRFPTLDYEKAIKHAELLRTLAQEGLSGVDEEFDVETVVDLHDVVHTDNIQADLLSHLSCSDAEIYFQATLNPRARHYNSERGRHHADGFIIAVDGIPVGFVKRLGFSTLLAGKTVINSDGRVPLVRGGLYRVDERVLPVTPNSDDTWRIYELPKLAVHVDRMLTTRHTLFSDFRLFGGLRATNFSQRMDALLLDAERVLQGYNPLGSQARYETFKGELPEAASQPFCRLKD